MATNVTTATIIRGANCTWIPIYDVEEEASKYTAYRIGTALHVYLLPVIVLVGLVFNIISLCVMLQAPNRKISFCIYLAGLTITDNLVLYSAAHHWVSTVVFNRMTQEECKHISGMFQMFSASSTFLIVVVTLDRFLATCYPLTTTAWRTPKRAYIMTVLVVVSCILCNIPMIYSAALVDDYTCVTFAFGGESAKAFAIVSTLLFAILPSVAILALNCAIVHSVKKREQAMLHRYRVRSQTGLGELRHVQTLSVSELTSSYSSSSSDTTANGPESDPEGKLPTGSELNEAPDSSTPPALSCVERRASVCELFHRMCRRCTNPQTDLSNSSSLDRQLAKMLLTVSITFLLLTLPQYIRYIVFGFVDFRASAECYAVYVLVVNITNKLLFTNSAINFVIYCISGRRFRKHLRLMIKSKRCCMKPSIVAEDM